MKEENRVRGTSGLTAGKKREKPLRRPRGGENSKVDVAFLCYGMDGGIGRYIVNMTRGLQEKGFRVHPVCLEVDRHHIRSLAPGLDFAVLPSMDYRKGVSSLSRYLAISSPEVLITPHIRHTIVALRARDISRVRTRIYPVVHTAYSEDFSRLNLSKRIMRRMRLRYYYPKCDGIIAVSGGVAQDLSRMTGIPEDTISVLFNPVVSREIRAKASQPLDHPWFEKGQPPVILGLGRLARSKNFRLLIDAFEMYRSREFSRLLILGEGPERDMLERRVSRSPFAADISLPGYVNNPYSFLKKSALLVLSSDYEGLPTVLVEAMAVGTPVVSTDCPCGPGEILRDTLLGPLVPLDDKESLARAIMKVVADPPAAQRLVEASKDFLVTRVVGDYMRFLGLIPEKVAGIAG